MMVEGEMNEVSEHDMLEAIKFAHEEIKRHCRVQKELIAELGNETKRDYPHDVEDEDLKKAVEAFCYDKCYALAKSAKPKHEREDGFTAIKDEFLATIPEEELEEKTPLVERYYHAVEKEAMRNMILDEGIRLDGRVCDQVRPIWCEVDYLPCAHGSAIFTRGETQSLATVTLGTKMDMKVTKSSSRATSSSSCTTTSLLSPPERPSPCALPAVVRSATAISPCAPSSPSFRSLPRILTLSAWSVTSSSPTVRLQWLPSAADASPSWTLASRSRSPLPEWPWA